MWLILFLFLTVSLRAEPILTVSSATVIIKDSNLDMNGNQIQDCSSITITGSAVILKATVPYSQNSDLLDGKDYTAFLSTTGGTMGGNLKIEAILDMDDHEIIEIDWSTSDDGAGSELDADKLDAQEGSHYLDYGNFVVDANEISGDKVNSGTISNFASTGIDDNADALAMTIDSSENIGIGISSPLDRLHIKAEDVTIFSGLRVERSATTTQYLNMTVAGGVGFINMTDVGGTPTLYFNRSSDGSISTNTMIMKPNGYVGISTIVPVEMLSVNGNVKADAYIEFSEIFKGDALALIKAVKAEAGETGDIQKVDHSSLSDFEKHISHYTYLDDGGKEVEATEEGRNLGNAVQINRRAIEQLLKRIEILETRGSIPPVFPVDY